MTPDQLIKHYPRLYHMAWAGSWKNIRKRGLLSTKALVSESEMSTEEKEKFLTTHRWDIVNCAKIPGVTIRDQKPMSDDTVRAALDGGDPREWYRLLNSMVFFWATKERLKTMMRAPTYKCMRHDLLVVDTARLIESCRDDIRISHMNSGATKPPNKRCFDLFKTLEEFPFDSRRKYGIKKAIAEICVRDRVENIEHIVCCFRQDVDIGVLDSLNC